jgi:hypothetical protein
MQHENRLGPRPPRSRVYERTSRFPARANGGEGQTIEGDETWIGGKAENRAFGPIPPKVAVVSLVQRGGGIPSFQVARVTATNLHPIVARHVHPDSRFITDESNVYAGTSRWFADYQTVNHGQKEYVRDDVYTNTVEGFFSILSAASMAATSMFPRLT